MRWTGSNEMRTVGLAPEAARLAQRRLSDVAGTVSESVDLPPFALEVHESSRPVPHSAPYCGSRDGDIPLVQNLRRPLSGKTRAWCCGDISACTGCSCTTAQQLFQLILKVNLCSSVSPRPRRWDIESDNEGDTMMEFCVSVRVAVRETRQEGVSWLHPKGASGQHITHTASRYRPIIHQGIHI
jgi:hypothetical protein